MATATGVRAEPWVDAGAAAAIVGSGTHRRHIYQWAKEGRVRVRRIPGLRPKYSRDDLERMARAAAETGGDA